MKASLICPTRDKRDWVERAANSYLRQEAPGVELEVVFFDQASTDGTLEILRAVAEKYDGPHKVRVLSCPDQGIGGTSAGMNADIAWVHERIEGEVILWGNADDFAYPRRVARTVRAFEETSASWVACCQFFMSASLVIQGETNLPDKRDRMVSFEEAVQNQTGSSSALAYARDLWDKYQPMRDLEQNDIVLPYMAFLERGMYFIAEPLHTYVFHASATNQGLGGQIMAAKSDAERLQKQEVSAFNLSSNWMSVLRRLNESGAEIPHAVIANINARLWGALQNWEEVRRAMTLARIPPVGMHATQKAIE